MHSNQAANPLGKYSKAMKQLTGKRKKTDADHMEIARLEWESALYLHNGVVVMPGENIDRCIWEGAKKNKNGKKWKEGAFVDAEFCALKYHGKVIKSANSNGNIPNPDLDSGYEAHIDQRMVRVAGALILRTRPIFFDWAFEFPVLFDETIIDSRTLEMAVIDAGRLIGLCEMRPRMGRFEVEKV